MKKDWASRKLEREGAKGGDVEFGSLYCLFGIQSLPRRSIARVVARLSQDMRLGQIAVPDRTDSPCLTQIARMCVVVIRELLGRLRLN